MEAEQRLRILGFFLEETRDYLDVLEAGLSELAEIVNDTERKTELYRAAHSIKGGAAMLDLSSIQKIAYQLENSLKKVKDYPIPADPQFRDLLSQELSGLQTLVEELDQTKAISEALGTQVLTGLEPTFQALEQLVPALVEQGQAVATGDEIFGSETFGETFELLFGPDSFGGEEAASPLSLELPEISLADEALELPSLTEAGLLGADLAGTDLAPDLDGDSDAWLFGPEDSGDSDLTPPGADFSANLSADLSQAESHPAASPTLQPDAAQALVDLFDENPWGRTAASGLDTSGPTLGLGEPGDTSDVGLADDFAGLFGEADTNVPPLEPPSDLVAIFEEMETGTPWPDETPPPSQRPPSDATPPSTAQPSTVQPSTTQPVSDRREASFEEDPFSDLFNAFQETQPTQAARPTAAPSQPGMPGQEAIAPDSLATSIADLDLSASNSSDLEELESLLGQSELELELDSADTEFLELEQLLVTPVSPAPPTVKATREPEFAELDALLGSGSTEFGDLDALLSDPQRSASPEFGDLETLLNSPGLATPARHPAQPIEPLPEPIVQGSKTKASVPGEDGFEDMHLLLEQAESMGGQPGGRGMSLGATGGGRRGTRFIEHAARVPVKTLEHLSNLVGEMVVNRNSLEGDQERLIQALEKLLGHVHQMAEVGQKLQDLYEQSLVENALFNSRRKSSHQGRAKATETQGNGSYRTGAGHATGYGAGHGAGHGTGHATGSTTLTSPGSALGSSAVDELDDLELDRFSDFHLLAQEIIEQTVRVRESSSDVEFIITESLEQITRNFRQITSQLQESVNKARMVPFSNTSDRLPRAVRDIARKCGKLAQLTVEGQDTLIDKMLVEQLHDPLTHLVNNAITHGVETPEERLLAGKSEQGNIKVAAFYQGNQTVISVADDGAGIDLERVKRKAIEKGLINSEDANKLGSKQLYEYLFHPGFSTRDQADNFAGRGVGLDVVHTRLLELRGQIVIDSKVSQGTTFTISLPLTLSITKALKCISNRAWIAFPLDGVENMFDVPRDHIQENEQGEKCFPYNEQLLPIRPLSDLLKYNRQLGRGSVYTSTQDEDMIAVVILRGGGGDYLAIQVDRVEGEADIVIKQLEGPVPKPRGIAGATVLKDGQIMPIADVLELIDLARGRVRYGAVAELTVTATPTTVELPDQPHSPLVLIVDDSVTVREMLSISFTKVGYRVEQARDGQEAWEKLRGGLVCELVICDIEMPRMTGLDLLSRLQKDGVIETLPFALLTSRGADKHRKIAADLGAWGYFTKPYLEENLLGAAKRLLQGERLL